MKPSESVFIEVRGLRYHVRRWPAPGAPKLFLFHGWMDVSASFQFLVDAFRKEWDVYAPDWRGYGMTDWGKSDCYWFPEYLADLEVVVEHFEKQTPVNLVGHSLGGNVVALYAGVRPERIAKLVNLEGFGMPRTRPEQAPKRYRAWLDELKDKPGLRPYKDFSELSKRLQSSNPRLTSERADFLARHWGREEGGQVVLRGDPAHKIINPVLYRYDESRVVWQQASAPVLWVEASESDTVKRMKLDPADLADRRAAFPNLRYAVVSDAGHMLHHDQPEAVARLIEDFLAGSDS